MAQPASSLVPSPFPRARFLFKCSCRRSPGCGKETAVRVPCRCLRRRCWSKSFCAARVDLVRFSTRRRGKHGSRSHVLPPTPYYMPCLEMDRCVRILTLWTWRDGGADLVCPWRALCLARRKATCTAAVRYFCVHYLRVESSRVM